jgi:UDP-N-acetylglucosamine 2-epimerase (non-hydrolysing)
MKIATIFGTRPEIIRLSEVIRRLDTQSEHVLIHTGQNYDPNLSDIFFRDLQLRQPDLHLGIRAERPGKQIGEILAAIEQALLGQRPDRILILGDTNSGLAAFVAARQLIPVYHMEAGNRCYDDRVPEEVNRRVIDHCSTVLLPYTHRSKENLLQEGIARARIYVTGNPIIEVLEAQADGIQRSDVLTRLGLAAGEYCLATFHRAENVDASERLDAILEGLARTAATFRKPVIASLHPRTADRIAAFGLTERGVRMLTPLGFHDFVRLQRDAWCILTDSGTVQEESAIFRVPNVTIRDATERPEAIECGSTMLAGVDPDAIVRAVALVTSGGTGWAPPAEYLQPNVSLTVTKIILGRLPLW